MEFRLLGPVQAWVAGHPIDLGERKRRLVLAVLLLEANQLVPVGSLVDVLWRDGPPRSARRIVQAHLSRLRTVLVSAGAEQHGVSLTRKGAGYLLTCGPEQVDAHQFRLLLDGARNCPDDHRKAQLLRQALALWRGPALADVAGDEVREGLCHGLHESRLAAVEERIDAELRLSRHLELIDDLTDLVSRHPQRQQFASRLMLALYRAGRVADALRVYEHNRRRLTDELGIDPSGELQRLQVAILRADPALDLVRDGADAPAHRGRPVPAQLPADIPDFTGRAIALGHLDRLLPRDPHSDVTGPPVAVITGIAGVGKTALAIRWAHRAAEHFPDGQLYVNLRGLSAAPPLTPTEALVALLTGLGAGVDEIPTDLPGASALLRSRLAARRVVVVLDDAGTAEQVRPLLPGSPGCLVLVTSRDRLTGLVAREGARQVRLDVLSPREAQALLARIVGPDLPRAEPSEARELAALCGYLPLALRMAAANVVCYQHTSLGPYVEALKAGNRLDELQIDGDEGAGIQAAFSLSYRVLPVAAQRLFRLMSLASGGDLPVDAAAALSDVSVERAQRLLHRLSDANLVEQRRNGRFGMHELLRCYAERQLDTVDGTGERELAARRLLAWYLTRADGAVRVLYPQTLRHVPAEPGSPPVFDGPATALAWLETERTNLVAVTLHIAADPALAPTEVVRLAQALYGFFYRRGHLTDWVRFNEAAIAAAQCLGDPAAEGRACADLGLAWEQQGRYEQALTVLRRGLGICRVAGASHALSTCLNSLGVVWSRLGQPERAQECVEESLALRRAAGDRYGEAVSLSNLGVIAEHLDRYERARYCHEESVRLFRAVGSRRGQALSLHCLGQLAERRHQYAEAARCYLGGAMTLRQVGDRLALAHVLGDLGRTHRRLGDRAPALASLYEALNLADELGVRQRQADCLQELALVLHRVVPEQAARYWQQAVAIFGELGLAPSGEALAALG